MKPQPCDAHLTFMLPASLKRELQRAAKQEGSVGEAIRTAIRFWLDAQRQKGE